MMGTDMDTTKYILTEGRKHQYRGITSRPLEERLIEHLRDGRIPFDGVIKVGHKSTWDGARGWEKEQNQRRPLPHNRYASIRKLK